LGVRVQLRLGPAMTYSVWLMGQFKGRYASREAALGAVQQLPLTDRLDAEILDESDEL